MMTDYRLVIDVTYDRWGQRSIRMGTEPEGVPASEVNDVIKVLDEAAGRMNNG